MRAWYGPQELKENYLDFVLLHRVIPDEPPPCCWLLSIPLALENNAFSRIRHVHGESPFHGGSTLSICLRLLEQALRMTTLFKKREAGKDPNVSLFGRQIRLLVNPIANEIYLERTSLTLAVLALRRNVGQHLESSCFSHTLHIFCCNRVVSGSGNHTLTFNLEEEIVS